MKQKVLETIRLYGMLSQGDSVLLALSGGKDSTALLQVMLEFKELFSLQLCAVHVNHGIRGEEAQRDERFVKDLCAKEGIDCVCRRVDIPALSKSLGIGIEECARQERYRIFKEFDVDKIATAHTRSDSVETMLFNLARGSGAGGLSGIPPVNGNIIRPLIDCTAEEIANYLKDIEQPFVEDSTNECLDYSRNRIRHKVVPELKEVNPAFEKNAAQAAAIIAEQQAFLHEQAQKALLRCENDAALLAALPNAVRHEALRILCKENCGIVPDYAHMEALDAFLQNGTSIQINGGAIMRIRKGKLEFPEMPLEGEYCFALAPGEYNLPLGILKAELLNCKQFENFKASLFSFVLDYDKIPSNLICRNKREGDRFFDEKRGLSKSLKKYLNEIALAPEKRNVFPVFAAGETVLGTLGSHAPKEYAPDAHTKNYFYLYLV